MIRHSLRASNARWTLVLPVLGAFLMSCASGDPKAGLDPNDPSPIVQLLLTPPSATVPTDGIVTFAATALHADSSLSAPAITWSATGGSITSGGVYTPGTVTGTYAVTADLVGSSLSQSAPVTIVAVTSPIVSLSVSPGSPNLSTGGTQQFSVIATRQDGSTLSPSVTWSATGGSITAGGLYTAGSTAGAYRVIAVQQGGTLADTATVNISAPVLQAVILSPSSASLVTGGTRQFSVTGQWSNGATTAPAVTYAATGGTITAGGLYTAGSTTGSFRVIATQQGGALADTSTVTITAPVLQAVILTPASSSLSTGATQQFIVSGQWSDGSTTAPAVTYTATGGTITAGGLYTAGTATGSFWVIAKQQGGTLADTSTVSVSTGNSMTLVSEGFEDGNLGSRGWFGGTSVSTVADARPGSTGSRAMEWHWTVGSTTPIPGTRIDFAPSNSVYLSYWVRQSSNWIGSGSLVHPHMFQFLTTADDHWIGPSSTHLTVLDELVYVSGQGGSRVSQALTDALNINTSFLGVDLTATNENRAVSGYNGHPESGFTWDEYQSGGEYNNGKHLYSAALVMTDATKTSWHHVESYWQLNSISGGKGQPDGVMQTWFDGVLVQDRHDVYLRTNANPTMQFRTFMLGPYIGIGSPRDQYMWIDDVVVSTSKP